MVICSNVEFEQLAKSQGGRILAIAKDRAINDPNGNLSSEEMHGYIKTLSYTEPKIKMNWLKNLTVLASNGTIARLKSGASGWEKHVEHIHMLHAAKQIPLNIGSHVQCNENKRYGTVVDYMPDTQEYVVALDPFQIVTYKKKDITKVARVLSAKEATQVRTRNVMYDIAIIDKVVNQLALVTKTANEMHSPEWVEDRNHWIWALSQEILTDVLE